MDDYVKQTIALYDQTASEYAQKVEKYGVLNERKKFCTLLPPGGNVLDAGCGPGRDSAYFNANGFSVVGVDLSDNLLAIARKKAPGVQFIHMNLLNLDFPNATFDGIWACASFHHLRHVDVPGVVSRCHTILKKSGILFVLVKAGSGEHMKKEPSIPDKKRFFSYYSTEYVSSMLKHANFHILDCYALDEGALYPERKGQWWIACFAQKV